MPIVIFLVHILLSYQTAAQPIAKFSFTQSSTCIKTNDAVIVGFRDESQGGTHSTDWSFGDGGISTSQNPTWTYTNAGVYYVTLTIKTPSNETSSVTQQIIIFPTQQVDFTVDVNSGCLPLSVVLTDKTKELEIRDPVTGTVYKEKISSRQWTFGDGNIGTSESATIGHTYTRSGTRDVALTVLYEGGCTFFNQSPKGYINIYPKPFADFYLPPPNACQYPIVIQSIDNSGNAAAYQWTFQGPTSVAIDDAAAASPILGFQQPGAYTVKQRVVSDKGCTDEKTIDYVLQQTNILASFTSTDSTCENSQMVFTNTSVPDPTENKWFVNGLQVGTQRDQSYLFSTAGTYLVRLETLIGTCRASIEKTIRVNPSPQPMFSADTLESCSFPISVKFFDNTTGQSVRRVWDFGDGISLTEKAPYPGFVTHVYTKEGLFSVKLSLVTDKNCVVEKTLSNMISIKLPRVIKANMPDSGCVPFKVLPVVRLANENEISSWEWEYTDLKGNVMFATSGPTPASFVFTDSGRYYVQLKVKTIKGCDRTFRWMVKAGFTPRDFDFDATPTEACATENFTFRYRGDAATGFKWFFNQSDSLLEKDLIKKFSILGPVDVKLIVYQYGCAKELYKEDYVNVKGVISSFSSLGACGTPLDKVILDNSSGNIQRWTVNYGDGIIDNYTSRRDSLRHTYAKTGQYTVSLKVEGDNCQSMDSININVADESKLDFTLSKFPVCVSDSFLNLIAVVDKPKLIKSYNWDLGCDFTGAGGSSALKIDLSSLCKYPANGGRGLYAMRLRIVDTNNCVITSPVKNILIGGPIVNYVSLSPISGCVNLPVNFSDKSVGDGLNPFLTKLWDFGDGTPAENILGGPVSHVFAAVGRFPVKLTITDAAGCSASKSTVVVNTSDPDIDFLAFDTASCLDKDIQLEAKSSVQLSSYFWNLGDNKTSLGSNPRVSYGITGKKTITLTIKDLLGCEKSITKPNYLLIDMPAANFVAEKDTADCPPFNGGFIFKGNFAESFEWDFGDGSSSTLRDPRHLYLQSGNYPVTLTVTSPGGCVASSSKPLMLVVKGPKGSASYRPTVCEPFNAEFNIAHSQSNFVMIDYGDGNISDTLPVSDRFAYQYADTGFYQPKIFLLNDVGCRILLPSPNGIKTVAIEPKFTPDINFMCDRGMVNFTDRTLSNETLISWKWDFGDGNSGTGAKPSHFYTSPGLYTVKLNAESASACFDTLTRSALIEVQARPDIGITSNKAVICEDDFIQFEAIEMIPSNSPVVSWFWDFTNGNSATVKNPSLQPFRKAGVYPFRLYVTNSKGCSDTLFRDFVVNANPILDAGADINLCLGSPVQLSPQGGLTYQWDPGPAISCQECARPFVNPTRDTVYKVKGFSAVGCTAVDSLQVKVIQPTTVTALQDTFVCEGESVQLFASGTAFYNWSPATGLSKTDVSSPVARPLQTTVYTVTGKDPYNCFVTTDEVLVRYVPKPKVDAGKDTTVMAGYPFALKPSYSNDVSRVQWIPSLFLNCADCKFPRSTPSYSATYTLFAYTDEGCMSKDVVNVFVTCTKENLYIPNTFSPNGDGMNEIFYPRGRGIEKIKSIKIFSRWGQLLYEKTNFMANDVNAGWNGKKAGQLVIPDVYVYMIELVCENGNIITWKGDVTLVR